MKLTRCSLFLAAVFCVAITLLPSVFAQSYAPSRTVPPPVQREFRGVWIATVYNLDWPSKAGLSADRQRSELITILNRAQSLNLNAVVLQVRPTSDALYESRLEPWSQYLTGRSGGNPGYDPLAFAVEEAHKRGLELHAWFNPYRVLPASGSAVASSHISKTHPHLVRTYGKQLWMDPGEPEGRQRVTQVILDVVKRYDIDAVHIDDYFYPYAIKTKGGGVVNFPDDRSWKRYQDGGGRLSRPDWRRENVNTMVRELYRGIKSTKTHVKFGISPFGIWRPGVPPTTKAGLNPVEELYADSRLWLQEGWLDYFSPQLYWSIQPADQSYPVLLNWWASQNRAGRHLWPGIATERVGPKRPAREMLDQILITREQRGADGHIHWSMKSLMDNRGGVADLLGKAAYQEPALVPASPWLSRSEPGQPEVEVLQDRATWRGGGRELPRWWVLQTRSGGKWSTRILPGATTTYPLDQPPDVVAVTGVNSAGVSGLPAVVERGARQR